MFTTSTISLNPLPPVHIDSASAILNAVDAATVYTGTPAFSNGPLTVDAQTSHAALAGSLSAHWAGAAQNNVQYATLSAPSATVRQPDGTLIASGQVSVTSTIPDSILLSGVGLEYDVEGWSSLASYAPALSGLGIAHNWSGYTVDVTATSFAPATIHPETLVVDGVSYPGGEYIIELNSPATLSGSGPGLMPAFTNQWQAHTDEASLQLSPGSGIASLDTRSLDLSQGIVAAGFSGAITITEQTTATDHIQIVGTVEQLLELDVSPTTNSVAPFQSAQFQIDVLSNLTDTYYLQVSGPPGWDIELDSSGVVVAAPGESVAQVGDYTLLVTAQSYSRPELIASAEYVVNLEAHQGLQMDIAPDPLITVPWGPADPNALPGDTNNGQVQLTGAAFTVDITNTSTVSHTFEIEVSGLPAGWLILSGAEGQSQSSLTLPAGGIGQVGLYISPTVTALPPAGTEYPFNVTVTAQDTPTLNQNDADSFIVPAIAFNRVTAEPPFLYVVPDEAAQFDLSVQNVGNAPDDFPVSITLPATWTLISTLQSPISLAAGASNTQTVQFTPINAALGDEESIRLDSAAPDTAYTQTTYVLARVVSQNTAQMYNASQTVGSLFPKDISLPVTLQNLGYQIEELELDIGRLDRRDRMVSAARAVANHSRDYPLATAGEDLRAIALEMAAHTTPAELTADLDAMRAAVADLSAQLTAIGQHGVAARFDPGAAFTLVNKPLTYTLHIVNQGTATTTYNINYHTSATLSTRLSMSNEQLPVSATLSAGQRFTVPIIITPTTLGYGDLAAEVTAQEAPLVQTYADAGWNSLDAFLGVLDVSANPPFVEYDSGISTTLRAQIANITNASFSGQGITRVWNPEGTPVFTDTRILEFNSALLPLSYNLGELDTTGLVTGVYTITLSVVDADNNLIPRGSGWGVFAVGQALKAGSRVTPVVVPPGTVTVTTVITTELMHLNEPEAP